MKEFYSVFCKSAPLSVLGCLYGSLFFRQKKPGYCPAFLNPALKKADFKI